MKIGYMRRPRGIAEEFRGKSGRQMDNFSQTTTSKKSQLSILQSSFQKYSLKSPMLVDLIQQNFLPWREGFPSLQKGR